MTKPENSIVAPAPDNGSLAVVTKTGFETSQGSLVRTMIFSSERVSVGNKEAFCLFCFCWFSPSLLRGMFGLRNKNG